MSTSKALPALLLVALVLFIIASRVSAKSAANQQKPPVKTDLNDELKHRQRSKNQNKARIEKQKPLTSSKRVKVKKNQVLKKEKHLNGDAKKRTQHAGEKVLRGKLSHPNSNGKKAHQKKANNLHKTIDQMNGGPFSALLCWLSNLIYNFIKIRLFRGVCGVGVSTTRFATSTQPGITKGSTTSSAKPSATPSIISSSTTTVISETTRPSAVTTTQQLQSSITTPVISSASSTSFPSSTVSTAGSTISTAGSTISTAGSTVSTTESTVSTTESTVSTTESTISTTESTVSTTGSTISTTESTVSTTESTVSTTGTTLSSAPPTTACLPGNPNVTTCTIATCACPGHHTLCRFNESSIGSACAPLDSTLSTVSDGDIDMILTLVNEYRRKVAKGNETRGNPGPQPQASNMFELGWGTNAGKFAQAWARQCLNQKDECRNSLTTISRQIIYHNASATPLTGPDWNSVITSWYDQVQFMPNTSVANFTTNPLAVVSEYTLLVWADVKFIGCGVSFYQSTATEAGYPYKVLYVCNFAQSASDISQDVYKQGPPGSNCLDGYSDFDGLCA